MLEAKYGDDPSTSANEIKKHFSQVSINFSASAQTCTLENIY